LWQRSRGSKPEPVDLEEARLLAEPGESVIRVGATLRYTSKISVLAGGDSLSQHGALFFKPRTTRAISFQGKILDPNVTWDSYTAKP
ncbi:MAG: hypothetical protein WA989_15455, partial [Henriciella sp.]|uniref:hypothetical protein n=1 Tax=Henriciella sp. TaxID=1968823 RepID=UPI003C7116F9